MSTTLDQRVVEMRFENQNFEKKAANSILTLDKLKQSLRLTGASKGLETVQSAVKKVDFSQMEYAATKAGFQIQDVWLKTASILEYQVAGRIINVAKNIASALTIDPINTGLSEYETKINAIQVIKANTRGVNTMEEITAALGELNDYADRTIYNFAQMTDNVGKFVAQGLDVKQAANAVQGLANLAGASGASATDMARATYQMSQALGGTIRKIDWNSLRNANMATVELKNTLMDLAKVNGIAIDEMIEKHGTFEDTLQEGWLTGSLFTEAMNIYSDVYSEAELKAKGFTDEQIANFKDLAKTASEATTEVKTFTQLWDVLKETAQSGWTQSWELIIGDFESAKDALTKLQNTFSAVINKMSDFRNAILKGALYSSWDTLAEKITKVGFTTDQFTEKLSETLEESGISVEDLVEKYGSLVDAIKAGAVPVKAITKALKKLIGAEEDAAEVTEKVTLTAEELEAVVKRVIGGEFGNGADRIKKLTEAGYDYATIQNRVNELLGSSVRHTSTLTEAQLSNANALAKMSDEELRNIGYTEDQIEALRELEKAAEGADCSLTDLINNLERPSGRTLLLESFVNIWETIKDLFGIIKEAWINIFGEKDTDDYANSLYELIESFHGLTESMTISEEAATNFRTIMEGLFAGFQLTGTVASKSVASCIRLLNTFLSLFGLDILKVTVILCDYVIAFNDWVKTHTMFGYGTMQNKMASVLKAIYDGVKRCIEAFLGLEKVQAVIEKVKGWINDFFEDITGPIDFFSPDGVVKNIEKFFDAIVEWIKGIDFVDDVKTYLHEGLKNAISTVINNLITWVNGIKTFDNLGLNIVAGILEGMLGAVKNILDAVTDIAFKIYDAFCTFFQVKSPSRLMMTLGGFLIAGLLLGIKDGVTDIPGVINSALSKVLDAFKNYDMTKISALMWGASTFLPGADAFNFIAALTNTIAAFGFESGGDIISGLVEGISSGITFVVDIIVKLAEALINGFKDKIDSHSPSKVFIAIGGFIIAGLLLGIKEGLITVPETLKAIAQNCIDIFKNIDWGAIFAIGFSIAGLILVKKVADILEMFAKPFGKMGSLLGALTDLVKSFKTSLDNLGKAAALNVRSKALRNLAIAVAILVGSILAIVLVVDDPLELALAVTTVAVIIGLLIMLAKVMSQMGEASIKFEKGKGISFDGLKQNLLAISAAILMIGSIVAILGHMTPEQVKTGFESLLKVMGSMLVFVLALKLLDKIPGESNVDKIGGLALKISLAMLAMIGVVKLAGQLRPSEITKGIIFMTAYMLFIKALIKSTSLGSVSYFGNGSGSTATKTGVGKVGAMLIGVSVAMGLMVGVCKLAAQLDANEMKKGALFAGAFLIFVKLLTSIASTGGVAVFGKSGSMVKEKTGVGKLGGMLLGVASAMVIMIGICKLAAGLSLSEIARGSAFAVAFLGFVWGLVKVTTVAKETQLAKITGLLLGVSLVLAVMAGLCAVLGVLSWEQLAKGIVGIGMLSTFLAGMVWAARGVQDIKGTMTILIIGIGMLAAIMAALLAVDDPKKLIGPVAALGALMVTFGYAIRSMSTIKNEKGLWKQLAVMVVVTGILAGIVAGLSFIPNPTGALAATAALSVLLMSFVAALKILGKTDWINNNIIDRLIPMGIVVVALAVILGIFTSKIGDNALNAIPAATALGVFLNAFTTSLWILGKIEEIKVKKRDIWNMVGVITGLGVIVAGLSFIPNPTNAIPAVGAIGLLLAEMVVALTALDKLNVQIDNKILGSMAILGAIAAELGVVVWRLSKIDNPANAIPAVIAVGTLMLAMSGVLAILNASNITTFNMKALTSLAILGAISGLFGFVIWNLSLVPDPAKAIVSVVAVTALMYAMTFLLSVINAMNWNKTKLGEAVIGIVGLVAMVAPMAAFVLMLSWMQNIDNASGNVKALTKLMWHMTGLLAVLSILGAIIKGAKGLAVGAIAAGILALTAMVAPMAAFILMLSWMQNINDVTEKVTSLTKMMWEMTALLAVLTVVGLFGWTPFIGILALVALVAAIAALTAGLGWLLEKHPKLQYYVDTGMPLLIQLMEGFGQLIGAVIGGIGAGFNNVFFDSLPAVGENFSKFMEHIAEAAEHAKGIESGSFEGFFELAKALGAVALVSVGNQIADFITFITGGGSSIVNFATEAIAFFKALEIIAPYATSSKFPNDFSVDGVISLLDALSLIGPYSVGNQFADWFTLGGTAVDKFKRDAVTFFEAMSEISKTLSEEETSFKFPEGIDIDGIVTLLTCLKKISNAMIGVSIGDLFSQWAGDEGAIEKFKEDGVNFFGAIREIVKAMYGENGEGMPSFPNFDFEGLKTLLANLQGIAWTMTGVSLSDLFSKWVGDEGTIEKFQKDGVKFFTAITAIAEAAKGANFSEEDIKTDGLDTLLATLKTVSDEMSQGWFAKLFDLKDDSTSNIQKFAVQSLLFFNGLKTATTTASEIAWDSISTAESHVNALIALITSLKDVDYSGVANFTGIGIGQGGVGPDGPIHDIAVAMSDFSEQLSGIDSTVMTSATDIAETIRTFINNIVGIDASGIENFKAKEVGVAVKDFYTEVVEVNTGVVTTALSTAGRIKSFITGLANLDMSGASVYKSAVNTLGEVNVQKFITAFTVKLPTIRDIGADLINALVTGITSRQLTFQNSGARMLDAFTLGLKDGYSKAMSALNALINHMTDAIQNKLDVFRQGGERAITSLVNGMSESKPTPSSVMGTLLAAAYDAVSGYSFYDVGVGVVDGLVSGISDSTRKAEAEAAAMAAAALEAAKEALGINSPSKEFYEIGGFANSGFVNALHDGISSAYNAGSEMAESARNGLNDAISKVRNLIDSDLDVQPTITPVLDLSNVQAGASSIANLFGSRSSLGINASIGAISSMMGSNQNGGNDDVVSAINKLRNDIGNISGDTYQINGITYDDGSAIAEAIAEITRTAMMERRI